jgi:hypothetical protein
MKKDEDDDDDDDNIVAAKLWDEEESSSNAWSLYYERTHTQLVVRHPMLCFSLSFVFIFNLKEKVSIQFYTLINDNKIDWFNKQ